MSAWTNETTTERVTEMWRSGHSAGVIAQALGISRNAVIGKMTRLEIERLSLAKGRPTLFKSKLARPAPQTARSAAMPKPITHEPVWIDIVKLEPGMCRYPRDGKRGVEYCGAPICSGSWCAVHRRVALATQQDRKQERKAAQYIATI